MSASYTYRRLLPGKTIRVLHLQPSADLDSPIRCTFEEVNLSTPKDQSCEYEALSYVWGSPVGNHAIYCEGQTIFVTENCRAALRRLRKKNCTRTLWVDAACIDQHSIEERNHQVRFMGDVYRQARQVLVWLGEDEHFAIKLRLIRWLGIVLKVLQQAGVSARGLRAKFRIGQHKGVTEMIRFFDHSPWINRAWTLQECMLARHKAMLIGSASTPWSLWQTCNDQLNVQNLEYGSVSIQHQPPCQHAFFSPPEWAFPHRGDRTDDDLVGGLLHIITLGWRRIASEPRDKVYAMHALLTRAVIELPDPDYNLPVEAVYEQFTSAIIRTTSSLRILQLVVGPRNLSELPFWVPDLSVIGIVNAGMIRASALDLFRSTFRPQAHEGALRVLGQRIATVGTSFAAGPGSLYDFWNTGSPSNSVTEVIFNHLGLFLYTYVQQCVPKLPANNVVSELLDAIRCCVERRFGSRKLCETVEKGVIYAVALCKDIVASQSFKGPKLTTYKDGSINAVRFGVSWEYEFGNLFAVLVQAQPLQISRNIVPLYLMLRGMHLVFTSDDPKVALTSGCAWQSDIIVALDGLGVPVILRQAGENFQFVGLAYCKTQEANHPTQVGGAAEFFTLI